MKTYFSLKFGSSQKVDSHDAMQLRKSTFILWKNMNFDIITVYNEKISRKKYLNYLEKLVDNGVGL